MWSHGPFNSIRISTTQSLVRCGSQRAGQNYARPESTSASRDYVGETLDLTELSEHLFLLVTSRAKESSKGARIGGRKIRGDWPRTQIGLSSWSSVTNIMTPVWLGRLYVQINLFTSGFDRETRIAGIVLLLVVIDDSVNYCFFFALEDASMTRVFPRQDQRGFYMYTGVPLHVTSRLADCVFITLQI